MSKKTKTKKAVAKKKGKAKSRALTVHKPQAPALPARPMTRAEMLYAMATDPKVSPEKLNAMTKWANEMEAQEARKDFERELAILQNNLPAIPKDKKGAHDIPYPTLEGIERLIAPKYHAAGFSVTWRMGESDKPDHYRIIGTLSRGGWSRDVPGDFPIDTAGPKGSGNKSAIQGVGSAMSYGQRRVLMMMFGLHIVGEDNDGEGGCVTDKQLDEINALCATSGVTPARLCKFFGAKEPAAIPARRFKEAIALIKGFKAGVAEMKPEPTTT